MMRRRAFLLSAAGVLAGCAGVQGAPAALADGVAKSVSAAAPPGGFQAFVLVHGAWHGGWVWRDVRARLEAMGRRVYTPTLTGLGERRHLLSPSVSLRTHIHDIVGVLDAEELSNVCLVGHSYAGMVITGVADLRPDAISSIVYLDAALPASGQSMSSQGPTRAPEVAARTRQSLMALATDGVAMAPPPPGVFGVPPENEAATAWMHRQLTAHPLATWFQPLNLTNTFALPAHRLYVLCANPVLSDAAFAWHHERLTRDPKWQTAQLDAGHNAMVTHPLEVAELLARFADDAHAARPAIAK